MFFHMDFCKVYIFHFHYTLHLKIKKRSTFDFPRSFSLPVVVEPHFDISSHRPFNRTYPRMQEQPGVHVLEFMQVGDGSVQVLSHPDLHGENSSFCPKHFGASII